MPLETFFTTTEQTNLFLLSILVGALLGVVYEIFRVIRITLPHNDIAVFFEDLLFSFIWGFSMLVFVIELGRGELRLFFVIGNIIGFVLYFLTVGNVVNRVIRMLARAVKWLFSLILRTFVRPVGRFFNALYIMLKPIFCNLYLNLIKKIPKSKKNLKTRDKVLYNNCIRKKESAGLYKKEVKKFGERKNKKTRNAVR